MARLMIKAGGLPPCLRKRGLRGAVPEIAFWPGSGQTDDRAQLDALAAATDQRLPTRDRPVSRPHRMVGERGCAAADESERAGPDRSQRPWGFSIPGREWAPTDQIEQERALYRLARKERLESEGVDLMKW